MEHFGIAKSISCCLGPTSLIFVSAVVSSETRSSLTDSVEVLVFDLNGNVLMRDGESSNVSELTEQICLGEACWLTIEFFSTKEREFRVLLLRKANIGIINLPNNTISDIH
jgi:hypothetical protein